MSLRSRYQCDGAEKEKKTVCIDLDSITDLEIEMKSDAICVIHVCATEKGSVWFTLNFLS